MPRPAYSQALAIAAPTAVVDELAPWTTPNNASDVAMAGTVWFGFHSLSAFLHVVAIVLALIGTLLPIPLFASMCSTVQLVEKKPERVEVALVAAPPPPPPARVVEDGLKVKSLVADGVAVRTCSETSQCKLGERCVDGTCVVDGAKKVPPARKKKRAHHDDEEMVAVGMLSILGSNDNVLGALSDAPVAGLVGVEGNGNGIFGGALSSDTWGGLGLSGTGAGGGETIGIGTIGTVVHGGGGSGTLHKSERTISLTLDGVGDDRRRAAERRLAHCDIDVEVVGTIAVKSGAIAALDVPRARACIKHALMDSVRGLADGTTPILITPHDPR
ncbi:MAG TPA: hypothetical protein VGO62_01470 [Myxococcota bacterium]|jgi:hypothetical protein